MSRSAIPARLSAARTDAIRAAFCSSAAVAVGAVVMMRQANRGAVADSTSIDPGEQTLTVSLSVSFELD